MLTKLTILATMAAVIVALAGPAAIAKPDKPGKVTICHKGKLITVSERALPAHERHGDTETCEEEEPPVEEPELTDLDAVATDANGDGLADRVTIAAGPGCLVTNAGTIGSNITIRLADGTLATFINGQSNGGINLTAEGLALFDVSGANLLFFREDGTQATIPAGTFDIVAVAGIDCPNIPEPVEATGSLAEDKDGDPVLKTDKGETLKLEGKTSKIEKALEGAAKKSPRAELKGKKSGDTLTVSTGKAKKR